MWASTAALALSESTFVPGPAHGLPNGGRRELRYHARRLGRRHRGAVSQDTGIHHQQFLIGTRFPTEHDPAEAHLGIDLQQQIGQLRFADSRSYVPLPISQSG